METSTRLINATSSFGLAHQRWRHHQAEAEQAEVAWSEAVVGAITRENESAFVDTDDPQWLDDDLVQDARRYLIDPDADPGELSPSLRAIVDEARLAHQAEMGELLRSAQLAAQDLHDPKSELDAALREWSEEHPLAGSNDEWPVVLASWRKAHNMTTRQAAVALGVSASAVTRYESGSRSPSAPQQRALVEAMIMWDPAADDSHMRRVRRVFSELFGEDPDDAAAWIDEHDSERLALVGQIEDALENRQPSIEHLRLLVTLVTIPAAMSHLAGLVGAVAGRSIDAHIAESSAS